MKTYNISTRGQHSPSLLSGARAGAEACVSSGLCYHTKQDGRAVVDIPAGVQTMNPSFFSGLMQSIVDRFGILAAKEIVVFTNAGKSIDKGSPLYEDILDGFRTVYFSVI